MTSPTPEPFEEEMLKRARWLCENRGEREIRLDKAHEVPFRVFKTDRLSLSIEESADQVQIALKHEEKLGMWLIYYAAHPPDESIFKPEHYEECAKLMRPLMVLDDLADV